MSYYCLTCVQRASIFFVVLKATTLKRNYAACSLESSCPNSKSDKETEKKKCIVFIEYLHEWNFSISWNVALGLHGPSIGRFRKQIERRYPVVVFTRITFLHRFSVLFFFPFNSYSRYLFILEPLIQQKAQFSTRSSSVSNFGVTLLHIQCAS